MARKHSTRHRARRKIEGAATACDAINAHLGETASWYEKGMPEVAQSLLEIGKIIEAARKLMCQLRDTL